MEPNKEEYTEENTPAEEASAPQEPAVGGPIEAERAPEPLSDPGSEKLVVAMVLAVIVIVLALMYLWGSRVSAPEPLPEEPPAPVAPPLLDEVPEPESLPEVPPVSASDDVPTLDAELEMPEIDSLDAELQTMEEELDAALLVE